MQLEHCTISTAKPLAITLSSHRKDAAPAVVSFGAPQEAKDADGCKAACQQETDCDAYVINYGFRKQKYKHRDEMYCSLYKNCVTEATPVRDALSTTWGNLKLYTCSK